MNLRTKSSTTVTDETTASDEAAVPVGPLPGPFARLRLGFRRFRRTRPFWGALALLFGAYAVGNPVAGSGFAFLVDMGQSAIVPMLIAFGMGAAALVSMFVPKQRYFPAIVAAALSVAALPLANLGGFVIGTVFGIIGSGMIFGWAPYSEKQLARIAARDDRRAARRAAKNV